MVMAIPSSNEKYSLLAEKCVISESLDSLILRSLQIGIEDEKVFVEIVRKYCSVPQSIRTITAVLKEFVDKSPKIIECLHRIYEESKLFELMASQRNRVG